MYRLAVHFFMFLVPGRWDIEMDLLSWLLG